MLKIVRIGKILPDGQFSIISSTEQPIDPIPFPKYKSGEEWESFLLTLYTGWDESWANPGMDD